MIYGFSEINVQLGVKGAELLPNFNIEPPAALGIGW
jgi:hypothetical protein